MDLQNTITYVKGLRVGHADDREALIVYLRALPPIENRVSE